jgi:glycosyltransferase involved in cell wall biosynthesis
MKKNNNKPILSIIVPVFNIRKYIEKTLKNLEFVSKKINCEIIFQDGKSTDGTTELIKKYCKKNKKWYLYSESDKGQTDAINKGIIKAKGEWITWLCGDDLLRKEFIYLFNKKELEYYDIVYGDVILFDGKNYTPAIGTENYFYGVLSKKRLIIQQPGTLIKKEIFKKLGLLNTKLNYIMDYEFFIRAEINNCKFKRYSLFIAQALIRPDAKTSSSSIKRLLEYYYIFLKTHIKKPSLFSFRPYIIYTLEFILKNLEQILYKKNSFLIKKIHSFLTNIFWKIALPKERKDIENRFLLLFNQKNYEKK